MVESKPVSTFPSYDTWLKDLGDWTAVLKEFLDTGKLKKIHHAVEAEYKTATVYPPSADIFNAFKLVPFAKIKAVIVGQDPYANTGEAMGLSFSVPKSIRVPGRVKNIYRALETDKNVEFKQPKPLHGDLTKWAKQGVLMLNSILTVRAGKFNSHKDLGWEDFTDAVIKAIGDKLSGIVFFLWGKFAQAKKEFVNTTKHLVLEYGHPSPMASTAGVDFTKCPHFSKANEYLVSKGNDAIDWNVD